MSPWTPAFARVKQETRVLRRRRQGLCRGRHHPERCRPSDDLRRPLFAARGKLCASADLWPRGSRLCAARRGRAFTAERNTAPAGTLALNTNGGGLSYMHSGRYGMSSCRRACARCAAPPPAQIPVPKSRSAMASAACSPPPVRSSCRTSRLHQITATIERWSIRCEPPEAFRQPGQSAHLRAGDYNVPAFQKHLRIRI